MTRKYRKIALIELNKLRDEVYQPLSPLFERIGLNSRLSSLYKNVRDTFSNEETRKFDSFGKEVTIDHPTAYNMFLENKNEIEAFVSESRPDDVFFDIGAAGGLFSCSVGVHLLDGQVHAFEPSYRIDTLRHNLRLNEISGTAHHCAIGKEQGDIGLTEDLVVSEEGEQSISMISIDDFTGRNPSPDLVKIDVEGAEIDTLQGMTQLLSEDPPRLLTVEIHPHLRKGVSECEIIDLLSSYGFSCESMSDTGSIKTVVARNE